MNRIPTPAARASIAARFKRLPLDWTDSDCDELPSDVARALWAEDRCPRLMAMHEERLSGFDAGLN